MGIFGFNPLKQNKSAKNPSKSATQKAVKQKLKAKQKAGGCEFC